MKPQKKMIQFCNHTIMLFESLKTPKIGPNRWPAICFSILHSNLMALIQQMRDLKSLTQINIDDHHQNCALVCAAHDKKFSSQDHSGSAQLNAKRIFSKFVWFLCQENVHVFEATFKNPKFFAAL